MDRYSKASEVWFLLHKAEQLVINDTATPLFSLSRRTYQCTTTS